MALVLAQERDDEMFLTVDRFPFGEYREMVIHPFRMANRMSEHDQRWNMQFRPLADAVISMLECSTSWSQFIDGLLRLQPHIRQRLTLSPDDHESANIDQSSFVTVPDIWLELFVVLARLSLVSSLDELGGPIVLRGESTTSEETASAPLTRSKVQKYLILPSLPSFHECRCDSHHPIYHWHCASTLPS
jgi:hypothetical protein